MPGRDESQTAIEVVDPLVNTIFDKRFRIEERLAAGGFGAIYRARHVKSGHPIALKVLHPTLASDLGVLARFRREGTTLTSLRNPHTITAYEFGQVDKTLFIVMELLHGESLYETYEVEGPLAWPRVANIGAQVCESLEEAHAQGIVHRDLKPTNIHLEEVDGHADFVKVLDFGIAKILQGSEQDASDITNAGQMIGTLDYMSPEQMVGGQVTGQTDIYTLGIVMYEMIAGTRPFPESATAGAALAAMLKTTPEPLYLRAPVPRTLDAIIMKCLERETQRRYRTVGELRRDLLAAVSDMSSATATVQMPNDVFVDPDETAITPPPEKILDALRDIGRDDTVAIDDARTPRAERRGLDDARTPRAEARESGRSGALRAQRDTFDERTPRPAPEWDEDDDRAATTTRRPDGTDLAAPMPPAPPTAPKPPPAVRPASLARPTPRPLESRHVSTPVPQVVVAPFSSTPRTPASPPEDAPAYPPSSASSTSASNPMLLPPVVGVLPSNPMLSPPGITHGLPPSNLVLSPIPPHAMSPTPHAIPMTPPMQGNVPGVGRPPSAKFDMGQMAAREAAVRRIIWIVVLGVAAGLGFILAMQL